MNGGLGALLAALSGGAVEYARIGTEKERVAREDQLRQEALKRAEEERKRQEAVAAREFANQMAQIEAEKGVMRISDVAKSPQIGVLSSIFPGSSPEMFANQAIGRGNRFTMTNPITGEQTPYVLPYGLTKAGQEEISQKNKLEQKRQESAAKVAIEQAGFDLRTNSIKAIDPTLSDSKVRAIASNKDVFEKWMQNKVSPRSTGTADRPFAVAQKNYEWARTELNNIKNQKPKQKDYTTAYGVFGPEQKQQYEADLADWKNALSAAELTHQNSLQEYQSAQGVRGYSKFGAPQLPATVDKQKYASDPAYRQWVNTQLGNR